MRSTSCFFPALAAALTLSCFTPAVHAQSTSNFDLPAQPLIDSLKAVASQTSVNVFFEPKLVAGRQAPALKAQVSVEEALTRLLAGTGLTYRNSDDKTVMIVPVGMTNKSTADVSGTGSLRLAQVQAPAAPHNSATPEPAEISQQGVPEILVQGSRVLNMDIKRSVDDAQPYVIFDRRQIEHSQATSLEDFLKYRLTMNTQSATNEQSITTFGTTSGVNLRGLGAGQTLILIDGRRAASVWAGAILQSDLNGIPLSAIERVEVLADTASGIYGGGATGGVINVVLRRDYAGVEAKATYDNTFDSDSAMRRLDLNAGLSLEEGKTSVLVAASYSDQNSLTVGDRDFFSRFRARVFANNPGFFLNSANPPLGYTTNIRSVSGTPLFGPGTSYFTSVPLGYAGGGGLAGLQANAGHYNVDFADSSQRSAFQVAGNKNTVLNTPTNNALMMTLRRQFTGRLQAFLDLGSSNNLGHMVDGLPGFYTIAATAPNNPFGQNIRVTVPFDSSAGGFDVQTRARRATGGVIVQLIKGWQAEVDYTWNRTRTGFTQMLTTGTESALIGNGTLDVLRDTNAYPLDLTQYLHAGLLQTPFASTLKDATLRLAGPLKFLPIANTPMLSLLLEQRDEFFGEAIQYNNSASPAGIIFPSRSQEVASAYMELKLPLISAHSRMRGVRELELQLAVRRDDYTVNGSPFSVFNSTDPVVRVVNKTSSTDPTIGLRYQPLPDLMLRASYGTGFFAPTVTQLVPGVPFPGGGGVIDPRRGNTPSGGLLTLSGGNPDLRPEQSESRSAGMVFTPRIAPGLRLSLDYTRIDKTDNISTLTSQQVVDNESVLADRVTRGPVPANDPYGVGPITGVDTRSVNISEARVEAYDLSVDYRRDSASLGAFDVSILVSRATHYLTQLVPSQPLVENAGIGANSPLKFKGNVNLTWDYGPLTLGWTARYFDSYLVANPAVTASAVTIQNQGSLFVSSQIYHDFFTSYRFPDGTQGGSFLSSLLDRTEIQFGVRNVFSQEPSFDAASTAGYSRFGEPRLANYYLSARKQF